MFKKIKKLFKREQADKACDTLSNAAVASAKGAFENGTNVLAITEAYFEEVHEFFEPTIEVYLDGKCIIKNDAPIIDNRQKLFNYLETEFSGARWQRYVKGE